MTIAELGSLGEFISSIAVIATLLFLGFQIRQGNILAKRHELNAGQDQISRLRVAVATHGDLAELWADGMTAVRPLEPAEQIRFDVAVSEYMFTLFHLWDRARLGLVAEAEWDRVAATIRESILANPGGSAWWEKNRRQFDKEFQNAIDGTSA